MTNDKEILELCAKAMGIPQSRWDYEELRRLGHMVTREMMWSPLTNPADYEQMEAEHGLNTIFFRLGVDVYKSTGELWIRRYENYADHNGDKRAAKRRAGCLVVAEIGKAMVK